MVEATGGEDCRDRFQTQLVSPKSVSAIDSNKPVVRLEVRCKGVTQKRTNIVPMGVESRAVEGSLLGFPADGG